MNIAFVMEARQALEKTSSFQKFLMKCRGEKIYLGDEQREGWTGKLPFYLFWCGRCEKYAKDYPHGYIERQYLICSHCGEIYNFVPWWVAWVSFWQFIRLAIKYRSKTL